MSKPVFWVFEKNQLIPLAILLILAIAISTFFYMKSTISIDQLNANIRRGACFDDAYSYLSHEIIQATGSDNLAYLRICESGFGCHAITVEVESNLRNCLNGVTQ